MNKTIKSYNFTIDNEDYCVQLQKKEGNKYLFTANDGSTINVQILSIEDDRVLFKYNDKYCEVLLTSNSKSILIFYNGVFKEVFLAETKKVAIDGHGKKENNIIAPMPGVIFKIFVTVGQKLKKGDNLIIVESMKMYNTITAGCDGRVEAIFVKESESVTKGQSLVLIS